MISRQGPKGSEVTDLGFAVMKNIAKALQYIKSKDLKVLAISNAE